MSGSHPAGRPQPGGRPAGDSVAAERSVAVVGGIAVFGAIWAWATLQLSARLAGPKWAVLPLGRVPVALIRLPSHLRDPRAVWPGPGRNPLPSDGTLTAVAIFTALLLVAAGVLGCGLWRRCRRADRVIGRSPSSMRSTPAARPPRRSRRPIGARWATRRDLRAVTARVARPGHLVIGKVGRHRLLATEARHSILVFGPTQSGKTSGLAIPAILEWKGPVMATSVKGDLAATTIGWRRSLGNCWVFDPSATSGISAPGGWSPLAEAGDWRGAQRVAGWMVEATPARSGLSEGDFWFAAAAKQLGPLLLAARCGGMSMADVVRWTNAGEWDEPCALLDGSGQKEAAGALLACEARDERIRSSVSTTLETVLAPFEDPTVVSSIAGRDIEPDVLLGGSNTLYLCGPSYEQARLQGLLASLVSSVVAAAVERSALRGGPLDPPLLLVLDEVANIAPIRDLDGLASTGAGLGIQLVTVCQDLAQLTARYGADRSRTIANNHRAKVMLSGVADLGTLDLVSGLAGEAAVREETMTADLRDGRRTRSSSVSFRRLAPADQLRRIRPGEGVVIYGHLPATRIGLRPWYLDRALRRRAARRSADPASARLAG